MREFTVKDITLFRFATFATFRYEIFNITNSKNLDCKFDFNKE